MFPWQIQLITTGRIGCHQCPLFVSIEMSCCQGWSQGHSVAFPLLVTVYNHQRNRVLLLSVVSLHRDVFLSKEESRTWCSIITATIIVHRTGKQQCASKKMCQKLTKSSFPSAYGFCSLYCFLSFHCTIITNRQKNFTSVMSTTLADTWYYLLVSKAMKNVVSVSTTRQSSSIRIIRRIMQIPRNKIHTKSWPGRTRRFLSVFCGSQVREPKDFLITDIGFGVNWENCGGFDNEG